MVCLLILAVPSTRFYPSWAISASLVSTAMKPSILCILPDSFFQCLVIFHYFKIYLGKLVCLGVK